jgi:UDP-glucuronate 4-epimerase
VHEGSSTLAAARPPLRVLVTGGAGFIGGHLVEALLARGDAVVALDAFTADYDPARKRRTAAALARAPGFSLVEGDLRDPAALARALDPRPDVVVHLAARAGVRASLEDPAGYCDVNLTGTAQLLHAMAGAGCGRLVFASSSSVYGARRDPPFHEDDPLAPPESPYAATKRAGELLCATWHQRVGLQATCLRFFTVYGPRQRPDMAIAAFLRRARAGLPLRLFGDGSSARDYTYVDDTVAGLVAAVDRPLGWAVVNLGNHDPVQLDALARAVAEAAGRPLRVERAPDQPGDVPLTCADLGRARSLLGYAPRVGLGEGLSRVVAWMDAGEP